MDGKTYIALLNAIEHLKQDIENMNPGVNHEALNADIQVLYDMVNTYQPPDS